MGLKVSRILHAGYLFEKDGTRVLFDPIFENPFSRNCHAFPDVRFDLAQIQSEKFTAVFISHHHDDHCSLQSLSLLDRQTPVYLYCHHEELFRMIRELGFETVLDLQINRAVRIGPFEITPRRALDEDVDTIFHIQAEGVNILNMVDSWMDLGTLNELAGFAPWDLVLWPFQTMREIDVLCPSRAPAAEREIPPEWIEQLQVLKPEVVVPSSCQFIHEPWSWYNQAMFPITYRQFQKQVNEALPGTQVIRLNPSQSIWLDEESCQRGESVPWVHPQGPQDVDYHFQAEMAPPATADIARHFEALTDGQRARVKDYVQRELIEKYNSLEAPVEEYFQKERIWCLSLFDHHGIREDLFYRIQGSHLQRVENPTQTISWMTEVPARKLYVALEDGESLTSMYVRINDQKFEPEIEAEIQSVDWMQDPLIRCLFHGRFGSYQEAQLRQIQSLSREPSVKA